MAIDFKTPEKFVFDHSENKQSDKLRQLLGLVYELKKESDLIELFKKSAVDPYIDFTQAIGGGDVPKFVVSRNQNKFGGSNIDLINAAETILIKTIENHINQVNNPDGENNSQFFEDFNFKIDKNLLKGFSVQTIVRDLQESDIQQGNPDYPGTENGLNPKKKETSLKFAYAFETIKIQGEEQIVAKKVKLVNGADDLIKRANNENNNVLEIEELQNLFYITSQDDEMNAQIIGEGSESNFDLDKIYNIIKIDLAAIKDPIKTENSIYNFSPYPGSPAINYLYGLEYANELKRQKIDNYKFLKYVTDKINQDKALERQYLPEESFNIFGYGVQLNKANSFYNFTFEQEENFYKQEPIKGENSLNNAFLKTGILTTFKKFDIITDYKYDISHDIPLSVPFSNYPSIDLIQKFQLAGKIPLSNYTEADLFRSAQKTNGKFVFDLGQRNDNLLRPAFPVGLRLVKSTEPYDPDNTNTFNNSILQTFYIPLEANPNENQIRLFDSQIIYGKTYYYTLFGIYYVDGKFYFYPYIKINKAKEKTGSVEIEIKENKVYRKKIITVGDNIDTVDVVDDSQKVYKNPCCEYNYFNPTIFFDSFIRPLRETRPAAGLTYEDSRKKSTDYFINSIKGINPGLSVEAEKSLNDLANIGWEFGVYVTDPGLKGDDIQLYNLLNLNSSYSKAGPSIRKAFNCFICREKDTIAAIKDTKNNKSFTTSKDSKNEIFLGIKRGKAIVTEEGATNTGVYGFIGKQSGLATNFIDCSEFGWNTIYGALDANQTNPPQASLENFGNGKDKNNNEIYEDGVPLAFGPLSPSIYPRCKREDRTSIFTEKFKDFKFQLFESNARRTYEIPLLPSLENSVVSLIPLPPIVEFVPLADINNRIKIKFQESAASGFTKVQVDEAVKILNGGDTYEKIVNRSKEEAKENGLVLDKQELLARSEGDIKEIYAFKLDRVPTSLQDLIDNGERFILDYKNGKTAYFSNVLPNEKYYYTFVSRDVTGLFSTATETFQVEIVEDSGYVYTKIDLYDYVTKEIKVTTKEFQKLLKIKPSFKQMLPNETEDGKQKLYLGTDELYSKKNFDGKSDTQPPKFKIRIKSKKTNRVFDINLKYSQDIKEITSKKLIEQLKKVSELVDQKKVKKNN